MDEERLGKVGLDPDGLDMISNVSIQPTTL